MNNEQSIKIECEVELTNLKNIELLPPEKDEKIIIDLEPSKYYLIVLKMLNSKNWDFEVINGTETIY